MTAALSIVLPTYNRWAQLRTVLDALSRQSLPSREFEVVVVSDGSTDDTDRALAAGDAPIEVNLVQQENSGPAVARNNGVEAAGGDLILFIDDDVVAEPGWAAAHLAAHERTDAPTVVIGPLLTPDDWRFQPWVLWEQRKLERQYEAMAAGLWPASARQFYTGNASLARDLFLEVDGFDPTFLRGEDVELAYRLADRGMAFEFDFDARAHHHARRSYESWLANAAAYGRNDAMIWRDQGREWLVPTIRTEYRQRNRLTRAYADLALRRPEVAVLAAKAVEPMAKWADRVGLNSVTQPALSALYNAAYYRGLVDELGGLDAFLAVEPAPEQTSVTTAT